MLTLARPRSCTTCQLTPLLPHPPQLPPARSPRPLRTQPALRRPRPPPLRRLRPQPRQPHPQRLPLTPLCRLPLQLPPRLLSQHLRVPPRRPHLPRRPRVPRRLQPPQRFPLLVPLPRPSPPPRRRALTLLPPAAPASHPRSR